MASRAIQNNAAPDRADTTPADVRDSETVSLTCFEFNLGDDIDEYSGTLKSSLPNCSNCNKNNIDECLVYLKQQFLDLPHFDAACLADPSKHIDTVTLVNLCFDLIRDRKEILDVRDNLEERLNKAFVDIGRITSKCISLKETLERKERTIFQEKEKERQLEITIRSLQDKLKKESDERKRLLSVLDHRKDQFQHEQRKKEREMNQLKERLQQILSDRNFEKKQGIEVINELPRSTGGQRKKWRTNSSCLQQENELNSLAYSHNELHRKELLDEIQGLKKSLLTVHDEVMSIVNHLNVQRDAIDEPVAPLISACSSADSEENIGGKSAFPNKDVHAKSPSLHAIECPLNYYADFENNILKMLRFIKSHIGRTGPVAVNVASEQQLMACPLYPVKNGDCGNEDNNSSFIF